MGVDLLAELQDMLMPGPLGGAVHIPGDGRCRKRRSDQARHVRRQPAGLPGLFFQGAKPAKTSITITFGVV
jgi:hypothetical protein